MASAHGGPTEVRLQYSSTVIAGLSLEIESRANTDSCVLRVREVPLTAGAEAQWDGERAQARILTDEQDRDADLAKAVAHRLCRASRRKVRCDIGVTASDIQGAEAAREVWQLVERAAAVLTEATHHRYLAALPLHGDILAASTGEMEGVQAHLARPVGETPEARSGGVLIFAPLYLNDACLNDCVYCGFRRSNRFQRTQLDLEQVLKQAELLGFDGHRTVDLVTGEIPSDGFVDRVATAVESILEGSSIQVVNLNLGALSDAQYRRLASAGAHGYHVYQETYDASTYFRMHRSGAKRDMAHRLEAPERALAAGFSAVSLGLLLGLRPLEEDLSRLAAHAGILRAAHPDRAIGFSLPRLQPFSHDDEFEAPFPVEDELFVNAFAYLRQRFPEARLCVTTRESADLRDRMLELGLVTKISAGVSTRPGGYGPDALDSEEQFHISDERSLGEMSQRLKELGYEPVTA